MTSQEIYEKYIEFFKSKGHVQIQDASLVPENDSSLLFVNAGMFPLVPFLEGEKHPQGKRLVNIQRSLRLDDIENVGKTNRHTTVFQMLGNWSLGDYFKKEQLNWIYEFYIDVLGLDPNKIYATVFEGNEVTPKDTESIEILKEIFEKHGVSAHENERIFAYNAEENWWQRGDAVGELGGPDSEVFYYIGKDGDGLGKSPAEHQNEFIEIGNNVFMQYRKTENGWEELKQKNVDFGGGLERIALAVQKKEDIYQTDGFYPLIQKIEELSGKKYRESEKVKETMRKVADHIRASTLIAYDGILPSNKDQGYILRRLLRRMVRFGKDLEIQDNLAINLVDTVAEMLSWAYPDLIEKTEKIKGVFAEEEKKFRKTLDRGQKETAKLLENWEESDEKLAQTAFDFKQSLGYPTEFFLQDALESGVNFDQTEIEEKIKELTKQHQTKSKEGAEKKFKGGLADNSETTTKYHTVTHLLHWALRKVLGDELQQQGSNITSERLRFDFSHDGKLTENEVIEVENLVNKIIAEKLPVKNVVMTQQKAEETGALHFFDDKYEEKVKVYFIGETLGTAVSKEFCGGPHVENTRELTPIEIYKQDKIGSGKLRIYARFR